MAVFAADTICALSTPRGRSALALIRVSGPNSKLIVEELVEKSLEVRTPQVCILKDSKGNRLDEAVVTFFKGPSTFTGEDLVEISCHGNPVIVESLLREIVSRETCRFAEAGEFSMRALANGRMSLDQVEALDLILNAPTERGVSLAIDSKIKGLGPAVHEVYSKLLDLISLAQAQLDFSEDEVGKLEAESILKLTKQLSLSLNLWANAFENHKQIFDKWVVALAGPPNSGKSSLFNAILGLDKAIVFDQPGTTRDYLEHSFELGGRSVLLVDTAGLREATDPIEAIGIKRSLDALSRADTICWVDENGTRPSTAFINQYPGKNWLFVQSKADLKRNSEESFSGTIRTSVTTGLGIADLRKSLVMEMDSSVTEAGGGERVALTSRRQCEIVRQSVGHLDKAVEHLERGHFLDMVTEEFLMASQSLKRLIEPPTTEDVLGSIFSRFCIGK